MMGEGETIKEPFLVCHMQGRPADKSDAACNKQKRVTQGGACFGEYSGS